MGDYYDTFHALKHPAWAQRLLVRCNENVARYLCALSGKTRPSVLEVGPGKGYFHRAFRRVCPGARYVAVDQNRALLDALGAEESCLANVPELPRFPQPFDIVYAAFVIEHLGHGRALHEFLSACGRALAPDGLLVLFVVLVRATEKHILPSAGIQARSISEFQRSGCGATG